MTVTNQNNTTSVKNFTLACFTEEKRRDNRGRIFRVVAALKKCSNTLDLRTGRQIHAAVIQRDDISDVYIANTLLDMYFKCRSMEDARRVFDCMLHHTVVTWTSMVRGYAESGQSNLAFQMYLSMQEEGFEPDRVTLLAALKACGNLALEEQGKLVEGNVLKTKSLERGRAVHRQAVEGGVEMNLLVASSLVDLYAKCGSLVDARGVFDRMRQRDVVSWTSLIMGYAESGESQLALSLFSRMQEQGCVPNVVTYMAALKACGNLSALEAGRRIEAQIRIARLQSNPLLATSLVDFYGKCGCMEQARYIFDSISRKDLVAWDALLSGYSLQGDSKKVIELLERMAKDRVKPDGVVFLSVLGVCSHAGLVDKGLKLFEEMKTKYGLAPDIKHYTCLVDLLGRANRVEQAVTVVASMPMQADLRIWMVLLGACHKWGNVEAGRLAFDSVLKLDERHGAAYVLMANIYSRAGMTEESEDVEALRRDTGTMNERSSWTDEADSFGGGHAADAGARAALQAKLEEIFSKFHFDTSA